MPVTTRTYDRSSEKTTTEMTQFRRGTTIDRQKADRHLAVGLEGLATVI
jgi:hypothetical protein